MFPCCVRAYEGVFRGKEYSAVAQENSAKELTLEDLKDLPTQFISNITVNDWQMHESRTGPSHHLMAFSPTEVKVIGKHVDDNGEDIEPPSLRGFLPKHMRLSSAMAISGAALSFDMGSYESVLDVVLDLLALLGIGMGDEMASDQSTEEPRGLCNKVRIFRTPRLSSAPFHHRLAAASVLRQLLCLFKPDVVFKAKTVREFR